MTGIVTAVPAPFWMTAMPSRHDHFSCVDPARRRRIRAAVTALDTAWRAADAAPDGLLTAIDALADAPADIAVVRLLPWLADTAWLRNRIDAALALLMVDPFARPPLRSEGGGDGGAGGLILIDRGAIRLTLAVRPADRGVAAAHGTTFVPGRAAIRILADGGASIVLHEVAVSAAEEAGGWTSAAAALCRSGSPRRLRTGETLHFDTARQSYSLGGAGRDVLLLELTVQPPSLLPIRRYDIASGRLAHVSASCRDSSFRVMALSLLRHFGRTDAAPLFAAETETADFAARWHAMRELIALDPAAARSRLAAMAADDPHPEVRRAAVATQTLVFPPSGETGREGGGGPTPSTPCADRGAQPCHA